MSVIVTLTVMSLLFIAWAMISPWVRFKAFEYQMKQDQKRKQAYEAGLRELEASVTENGTWTI